MYSIAHRHILDVKNTQLERIDNTLEVHVHPQLGTAALDFLVGVTCNLVVQKTDFFTEIILTNTLELDIFCKKSEKN